MRLIYFSPVAWSSFTQRPHEFVQAFHAQTGGDVVWVEPYPTRLPRIDDFFRLLKREAIIKRELPTWMKLVTPSTFPVEPLPFIKRINHFAFKRLFQHLASLVVPDETILAIGKPSDLALSSIGYLKLPLSIYDAMDDFPQFYSGISARHLKKIEQEIVLRVTKVIVSSSNLKKKIRKSGVESELILNACSSASINSLKGRAGQVNSRPVLGYVGTIAKWFDWDFVVAIAKALPHCEVRLIGPLLAPIPIKLPQNVLIFPSLSHSEALKAIMQFDIALIPFKRNELTYYVDPIKYYEYRALGLSVISTNFGEMAYRQSEKNVHILDSNSAFKSVIEKILEQKNTNIIDFEFIEKNNWDSRFGNFFSLLK